MMPYLLLHIAYHYCILYIKSLLTSMYVCATALRSFHNDFSFMDKYMCIFFVNKNQIEHRMTACFLSGRDAFETDAINAFIR